MILYTVYDNNGMNNLSDYDILELVEIYRLCDYFGFL